MSSQDKLTALGTAAQIRDLFVGSLTAALVEYQHLRSFRDDLQKENTKLLEQGRKLRQRIRELEKELANERSKSSR